jgi:c-di-GMP-binding flagellar brake protein YcgR
MQLHEAEAQTTWRQKSAIRRYLRHVFTVPVTVRHWPPQGFRTARGITLDIGEGGMAALVPDSLCVGEIVEIDLPLPVGLLNTLATVRYSSENRAGFEFVGLSPQERQQINLAAQEC